jgi:hypothetical protein
MKTRRLGMFCVMEKWKNETGETNKSLDTQNESEKRDSHGDEFTAQIKCF